MSLTLSVSFNFMHAFIDFIEVWDVQSQIGKRLPATRPREIVSSVAKNLNSIKHFVNLHNYERFFRYLEQSSITSQFSVSLQAAKRNYSQQVPHRGYSLCCLFCVDSKLGKDYIRAFYKLCDEGELGSNRSHCSYLARRSRVKYETDNLALLLSLWY